MVDSQYAALGVVFDSSVVLQAPGYNDSEYPPRSGSALATADYTPSGGGSGVLYVHLDDTAVRVRGYVTSFSPLALRCYNVADSLVAEATDPGANLAQYHGGPANRALEVSGAGIRHCQFVGPDNQYSVDDLTVVWRDPVPTLACDTVVRGTIGTCSVPAGTAVVRWEFEGVLNLGSRVTPGDSVVTRFWTSSDTVWQGTAVLSGSVTVVRTDSSRISAPWVVRPREGPTWRWGPANWKLLHDGPVVKCQFLDFVQWPVDTTWSFGSDSGRVAVNRRGKDCSPGVIEPNLDSLPNNGRTIAPQVSTGPNAGMWYVLSNNFHIDRVSEMNPWLKENGIPVLDVLDPNDYQACYNNLADPKPPFGTTISKNWHSFNNTCVGVNMSQLFAAIWSHEENGTIPFATLANANGHYVRITLAAAELANDPRALVESLVSKDYEANLQEFVRQAVLSADNRIVLISSDHHFVKDNANGACVGGFVLRIPPAPTPKYYWGIPFTRKLSDGTIVCI